MRKVGPAVMPHASYFLRPLHRPCMGSMRSYYVPRISPWTAVSATFSTQNPFAKRRATWPHPLAVLLIPVNYNYITMFTKGDFYYASIIDFDLYFYYFLCH